MERGNKEENREKGRIGDIKKEEREDRGGK
jgi:hypothetical protein